MARRSMLRLWRYASFDSYFSWIIFLPSTEETGQASVEVCRVEWRRYEDYDPDASRRLVVRGTCCQLRPGPTLYLRPARVPREHLAPVLEELMPLSIPEEQWFTPVQGTPGVRLDGEGWGIEYYRAEAGKSGRRKEWWIGDPQIWPAGLEGVRRLHDILESYLQWEW